MSPTINIDRFTRLKQSIAGKFSPRALPSLVDYLAGDDGEISFTVSGNLAVDLSGGQERRITCIIYGWLLLFDPVTLLPVRYPLDITSSLVLVKDESELPPLGLESEGEDYIVCGINMDVAERIEEEILLSLPAHTVNRKETNESRDERVQLASGKSANAARTIRDPIDAGKKISAFAKLVELKKK